jgi:hypothetical protein
MQACQENRKFYLKNLVNKIHKLVVKKLKLNVDCHIKTQRNHNLLQV